MVKPKLFLGLSAVGLLLTSMVFAGQDIIDIKEGLVVSFMGDNEEKIGKIESDLVDGTKYHKDEEGNLTEEGWNEMITESYKFCEEAVEQGSVLIKNDNNCLPITKEKPKVTLFGNGSANLFMRSGAGGAAPNPDYVVDLATAFERAGYEVNREIYDKYPKRDTKWLTDVDHIKDIESGSSFYTQEMKDTFSEYNDAAIITLVRIGTEDTDPSDGSLDITDKEKSLLKMVKDSGQFDKIIVLLNAPMPMSMNFLEDEEYGIDAAVFMGVPGFYGAPGIANMMLGKSGDTLIDACGHAPDTFAASASSSAAYVNFNRTPKSYQPSETALVTYLEGVYVGYKYYETRYEDCVLNQGHANCSKGVFNSQNGAWNYADEIICPFGYGLSYTTFDQEIISCDYNSERDQYDIKVKVTNTGTRDGKASIQVYVQQPYTEFDKTNGLGRPSIAIMNYAKVDVKAGESVEQVVPVDRYFLATYDYKVDKQYTLEEGDYYFAIGNGAHEALNNILSVKAPDASLYDQWGNTVTGNSKCVYKQFIKEDKISYRNSIYNEDEVIRVTNQFDDADYNYYAKKNNKNLVTYLDRQDWEGTYPTKIETIPATSEDLNMSKKHVKTDEELRDIKYSEGDGLVYNVKLDKKITFNEMTDVPITGTVEKEGRFKGRNGAEVWDEFISQMDIDDLIISVSDNRGILDVAKVVKKGNSIAEGPEGILSKFKFGDNRWATGFPTGPTYTGTFDHEMQKKFGGFFGEEALYCGVACINAPGCNINRTPYGSRASEYMTEDGVMNYLVASNVVGEARRKGLIMNIKHCFLNNAETARQGVQTYCNEQAIREIYLRPFEGALTRGRGLGIMTSYNRIGATYAATHKPLMMNVMRGEWAYKGQIIDDALQNQNSKYQDGPTMLYCGTDIFCLDGGRGKDLKKDIIDNDDMTNLRALQRANKYIMYSMTRSWMGGVATTEEEIAERLNPVWKQALNGTFIGLSVTTAVLLAAYITFEVLNKLKIVK